MSQRIAYVSFHVLQGVMSDQLIACQVQAIYCNISSRGPRGHLY